MARQVTKPGLTTGQHATIDHTGITGVGGTEVFDQTAHDLEDHTGLPGVIAPIPETFDQTAHDLEDHSSVLGVPSITGLLDETAHDGLDHTGLTGCGGLDETAHDELDHAGLTGVPSVEGLLDETAHDELDHAGLTGIPSISGLLDETAHDALDHAGLTGIGSVAGTWTSNNNVVDAVTENITIANTFSALITKILITATDGGATPAVDYDIDIYTDAGKTALAYSAVGITDLSYLDLIPWEWFGGTSMYITITSNQATPNITDLDISISYRR
jgi:hypothetical protein